MGLGSSWFLLGFLRIFSSGKKQTSAMDWQKKISQSHGNPEIYKNITRNNKNITTNKINQMRL